MQNTLSADVNEIMTGYFINGGEWFSPDAKSHCNTRLQQISSEEAGIQIARAKVMASEFIAWAKSNGYSGTVAKVWWTARPGSMSAAVGQPVDQRKNPTDILVKFSSGPANGFLGLSAKSTASKGDIGFKNPGVGTVDKSLGLGLAREYENQLKQAIKKWGLPENASQRKSFIRANPGIQKQTQEVGAQILHDMRDEMFVAVSRLSQDKLLKYLLNDWMDADVVYPPYVKVTGKGTKEPFTADVSDPTSNPKLKALTTSNIVLSKEGTTAIGVAAGGKRIMKMRFKFESEKLASAVKLTGDPW